MHVLMLHNLPVAVAQRFERLNEAMTQFTADQQKAMTIVSNVEVLK